MQCAAGPEGAALIKCSESPPGWSDANPQPPTLPSVVEQRPQEFTEPGPVFPLLWHSFLLLFIPTTFADHSLSARCREKQRSFSSLLSDRGHGHVKQFIKFHAVPGASGNASVGKANFCTDEIACHTRSRRLEWRKEHVLSLGIHFSAGTECAMGSGFDKQAFSCLA